MTCPNLKPNVKPTQWTRTTQHTNLAADVDCCDGITQNMYKYVVQTLYGRCVHVVSKHTQQDVVAATTSTVSDTFHVIFSMTFYIKNGQNNQKW